MYRRAGREGHGLYDSVADFRANLDVQPAAWAIAHVRDIGPDTIRCLNERGVDDVVTGKDHWAVWAKSVFMVHWATAAVDKKQRIVPKKECDTLILRASVRVCEAVGSPSTHWAITLAQREHDPGRAWIRLKST